MPETACEIMVSYRCMASEEVSYEREKNDGTKQTGIPEGDGVDGTCRDGGGLHGVVRVQVGGYGGWRHRLGGARGMRDSGCSRRAHPFLEDACGRRTSFHASSNGFAGRRLVAWRHFDLLALVRQEGNSGKFHTRIRPQQAFLRSRSAAWRRTARP